jgi:hypothetical protein
MPGVGQAIQIHQPRNLRTVNDVLDHIGPDKPRTAGDQQVHFAWPQIDTDKPRIKMKYAVE